MRPILQRLWASTLWAQPHPILDLKYQRSKLVYVPLYYIVIIIAGHSAAVYGVPTIEFLFPWPIATFVSYVFCAAGIAGLIGNAFPGLWRLEVYSSSVIFGLLLAYGVALILRAATGGDESSRSFVGILSLLALSVTLMRIDVLGTEKRIRDAKRALLKSEAA